jgi:glycosyltransferase involved in cell wall biosynthesis
MAVDSGVQTPARGAFTELGAGVLMLVENNFPADTRVRNEAFTLAANGLRVTVIALRGNGEKAREVLDGVTVYRVPRLTLFDKLPHANAGIVARLLRRIMVLVGYIAEYAYFTSACLLLSLYIAVRERFNVVHAHNPPDTLAIVTGVLKLLGKKSVFDHHDLSPELYLSRYKTNESVVTAGLRVFERLSVRLADVVVATNESYKAIDIERNGADPSRVYVVRNGPNLARVRLVEPDARLRAMGKTILGYVGAMNPQDGVDYMLRALAILKNELGRRDFFCVIIGDGDSRHALEEEARALGLTDEVWFTGFVPDADMVRYLSTADICLDPNPSSPLNDVSTWIKVMEYMALEKPLVSFDLKETRTSAGEAALFVPPNNEADFARAVARLMDDPALRQSMGRCGRERVLSDLRWDVTSRNLISAYEFLLKRAAYRVGHQPVA